MSEASIRVFDMAQLPWRQTANPGLWLKPVREDAERGEFLGLVRFDAGVRSGLHQHQGVATSFVVEGGLTDYHGSIGLHEAGINQRGSTHDAIAYAPTLLVSRLEGRVSYPPNDAISGVHTGSYTEAFVNPDPDVPPEINVPVDALPKAATRNPGLHEQLIFDYAGTGTAHRYAQWHVRPHTQARLRTAARTELWVRGGNLSLNGHAAHANCFVCIDAHTEVAIDAPFGALLLVWADGAQSADELLLNI
jgi:hypothetical protein